MPGMNSLLTSGCFFDSASGGGVSKKSGALFSHTRCLRRQPQPSDAERVYLGYMADNLISS
eukprot:4555675-Amphidinium_carterae.1